VEETIAHPGKAGGKSRPMRQCADKLRRNAGKMRKCAETWNIVFSKLKRVGKLTLKNGRIV
jgi:hypothetical protein